jgi:major membrane immunogen (membrane-anchored lipoprotein)
MIEIGVRGGFITQVHYDEIARDESGQVTARKLYDYDYAQRWRNAIGVSQLTAFPAYGQQLIATGDPEQVDVLSGATGSHEWFQEMARDALNKAQ